MKLFKSIALFLFFVLATAYSFSQSPIEIDSTKNHQLSLKNGKRNKVDFSINPGTKITVWTESTKHSGTFAIKDSSILINQEKILISDIVGIKYGNTKSIVTGVIIGLIGVGFITAAIVDYNPGYSEIIIAASTPFIIMAPLAAQGNKYTSSRGWEFSIE